MVTFSQLQLDTWLAGLLLPFIRVLALFTSAPLLSMRNFPVRARVAAAAVIALPVAPFAGVPPGLSLASTSSRCPLSARNSSMATVFSQVPTAVPAPP